LNGKFSDECDKRMIIAMKEQGKGGETSAISVERA